MAQNHIEQSEAPMTRGGTIQGPSRRYRRLRHPTFPADEWTANNPLLQRGELGIESDTHQIKAGDGYTLWNDLPYASSSGNDAEWGAITGTLSDQTDLQDALDAKVDVAGDTMTGDLLFTRTDPFSTSKRIVFDEVDPVYNRVTIAKRTALNANTGDQILHFYGGKSASVCADFYMDFVQHTFFCQQADATLGSQYYPWAKIYVAEINNGAAINVPTTGGTMVVATPPTVAGTYVLKAVVDGDGNITTQWVAE